MPKLRIAIDIEGVLRDTFEKIEQIYQRVKQRTLTIGGGV